METQNDIDADTETELESQSQVPAEESQNVSKKDAIPRLYGVYLLNSLTKKTCYYVGSTPDPHRRLRQHNGELTSGGAYRTKKQGSRPWRMILYVYGFPSKINALQFEHAWQHSYQTRHIPFEKRLNPGKRSSGSGSSIHSKLANCRMLLNSDSFKRLGLKVAIFDDPVYDVWLKNRYGISIPDDILIDVRINSADLDDCAIKGGNYNQLKDFMERNNQFLKDYFTKCDEIAGQFRICKICTQRVSVENSLNTMCVCVHRDCNCVYHLDCLAAKFLNDEECDDQILPKRGKCAGCNKVNFWNLIMRGSRYLQNQNQDI